ncbi:hypothetical protein FACS1894208_04420 [Clostridia bacterium]|nr:hypothetical protein FACS1894208_04420 [Clostridia bacterium]
MGNIVDALPPIGDRHEQKFFSIGDDYGTGNAPYTLTVYYEQDGRIQNDYAITPRNAVLLFALIDNLREVSYAIRTTPSGGTLDKGEYLERVTYTRGELEGFLATAGVTWESFHEDWDASVGKAFALIDDGTLTVTSPTPSDLPPPIGVPALEKLPADYGKEQAARDGVYVNIHGSEIFNASALINFYAEIDKGAPQPAFVRTMFYTVEGDPIITDYQFDGEKYTVTLDTTRDKFSAQNFERRTYKYLVSYTPPANSFYLGSTPLRLFSGTPAITDADWERGGYYELPPLPPVTDQKAVADAIRAAQAYYDNLTLAGKMRSAVYTLIEDISKYADYVIPEMVKGEVLAFYAEAEGGTTPPRTIVLTQSPDGGWEVINEGY